MILVILILILILSNVLVFFSVINSTLISFILALSIGAYRGIIANVFKDVFNLYPFLIKLNSKDNILELIGAFLFSLVIFTDIFIPLKVTVLDILSLVVFTLFLYRFLFYNLTSISNKKSN